VRRVRGYTVLQRSNLSLISEKKTGPPRLPLGRDTSSNPSLNWPPPYAQLVEAEIAVRPVD